jgi:hypothetical protein
VRAAFFALVLAASGAEAQRIRLSGPSTRNGPTAQTTPAESPAALGGCAALAGAYASATAEGDDDPSPYFCNGVEWSRLWREADGAVAKSTSIGEWYSLSITAPSPDGIAILGGGRIDLGGGSNDYCEAQSGRTFCPSLTAADLVVDDIGNRSSAPVEYFSPTGVRITPYASLPTCTSLPGNLATLEADGGLYQCEGTTWRKVSRSIEVPVTFDFPNVPAASCVDASVTVTGAANAATLSANADFALPSNVGIGNVDGTGTDTVSLRLCNVSASDQDPPSGSYRFRIER